MSDSIKINVIELTLDMFTNNRVDLQFDVRKSLKPELPNIIIGDLSRLYITLHTDNRIFHIRIIGGVIKFYYEYYNHMYKNTDRCGLSIMIDFPRVLSGTSFGDILKSVGINFKRGRTVGWIIPWDIYKGMTDTFELKAPITPSFYRQDEEQPEV